MWGIKAQSGESYSFSYGINYSIMLSNFYSKELQVSEE